MSDSDLRATLRELSAQVRNDSHRGGLGLGALAARYRAVGDAARHRERFALRQALLELAACATMLAARLPAPAAPVPHIPPARDRAA
jgi:hypothetical protein